MRIGVTGGAGYIGSHVVADLIEAGHSVIIYDNFSTGRRENVLTTEKNVTLLEGDVRDPSGLEKLFALRPEVIFHFAAFKAAGDSMIRPTRYSDNNLRGTLFLLETMLKHGCKNFVFSSSAAVYGSPQYLPIDEHHPTVPENYYGFSKLAIEQNLEWMSRLAGLRFASLRYFNAAGYDVRGRVRGLENDPQNLIPIVMEVASRKRERVEVFGTDYQTRDGTCIRDYIHVNDLSAAHILGMNYLLAEGHNLTVNLGSERGVSVREMLAVAREVTGQPIAHVDSGPRAGDPPELVASARRAYELLGWRTRHSDPQTLIETTWRVYNGQS